MPSPDVVPSLGIIGAGKVGSVLARLWSRAGFRIVAVHSRTPGHATELAAQVNAPTLQTPDEVVARADLTLLTIPDDAIAGVAEGIARSADSFAGKGVVHTAGAQDATMLQPLSARGAQIGSLHPAYPFADVDSALAGFGGITFAVEAQDEPLLGWLHRLVLALNSRALVIPPGYKTTYHLALALASNYAVTLYAVAERLLLSLGTDQAVADDALNALLSGTMDNLRRQGIPAAMVGPLTRADLGTIAAHLEVLRQLDPTLRHVYKGLARLSFPMLKERGIATESIDDLLRQDDDDETDHT
jgi:predicted short-subunit dehydrogenase-like oxidoreductase (DUF2520 family)